MNCVRKHLSAIKGGRLAALCAPARVVTLLISDVPGDAPAVIGSGPTVPDPTTLRRRAGDPRALCDRDPGRRARRARERRVRDAEARRCACSPATRCSMIATPQQSLEAAAALRPRRRPRSPHPQRRDRGRIARGRQGARGDRALDRAPRRTVRPALRRAVGRRDHGDRQAQGRPRRPRDRVPARLRDRAAGRSRASGCWRPTPTASTASRTTPAPSSRPTRWRAPPRSGLKARDFLDHNDAYYFFKHARRPADDRPDLHQRQRLPGAADPVAGVGWSVQACRSDRGIAKQSQ